MDDLELPKIPDKHYFTISEVSELCGVKQHVLRYWEQEFSRISPSKRKGRRYYKINDILIIRLIRKLLHIEKYTILGAKRYLQKISKSMINNNHSQISNNTIDTLREKKSSTKIKEFISYTISELESLLDFLK